MRTTVDIHEELLVRAKQAAAAQRRKLSDLVNDGLLEILERGSQSGTEVDAFQIQPFQLGRVQPGIDFSDNASILDALDENARDPNAGRRDQTKLR